MTVPISADGYVAPRWVKWIVTIGHILAIVALLFPIRGKPFAAWLLSTLFSLFATLQVTVLWFWTDRPMLTMTESEWLTFRDPMRMLAYLEVPYRPRSLT